jgi:hypothetical protein
VTTPGPDELYCYCNLGRRGSLSAYLVRRLGVGPVVASIEPLGVVRTAATDAEVLALGLKRRLWISGRWRPTASGHHALVRVRPLPRDAAG